MKIKELFELAGYRSGWSADNMPQDPMERDRNHKTGKLKRRMKMQKRKRTRTNLKGIDNE